MMGEPLLLVRCSLHTGVRSRELLVTRLIRKSDPFIPPILSQLQFPMKQKQIRYNPPQKNPNKVAFILLC